MFLAVGTGVAAMTGRVCAMTEEERVIEARQRLEAATQHVVLMPQFPATEADVDSLKRLLLSEYKVQLWASPDKAASGLPIVYAIKARGIYHDIKLLYRQATGESVLEFWIVQIVGQDWAGVDNSMEFKIVETDSVGLRRIILSEDQFRATIPLPDGRTLTLPAEDEKFLYQLNPSGFPEHFKASGLADVTIYIDEDGQYRRQQ